MKDAAYQFRKGRVICFGNPLEKYFFRLVHRNAEDDLATSFSWFLWSSHDAAKDTNNNLMCQAVDFADVLGDNPPRAQKS